MFIKSNIHPAKSRPGGLWSLRRNAALLRLAAVTLLVTMACNLTRVAHQPPSGKTPVTPPAAGRVASLDDYDLFSLNVRNGTWSQGQGLLKMLGYLNREVEAAQVFGGKSVVTGEATGLLEAAGDYLAANPHAPEKAEIERMQAALIPDPQKILPFAAQVTLGGAASNGGRLAGLAEPSMSLQEVFCNTLWADGFSTPPGGSSQVCASWSSFSAGGAAFRIFTARDWPSTGDTTRHAALLNWTRTALSDSAGKYAPLALHGLLPTDVVFNELPFRPNHASIPEPNGDMAAASLHPGTCTIAVFPAAFGYDEKRFEQSLAHEMFHCFQVNNLAAASSAPYNNKKWWMEGAAEYFSNVVYPGYNDEFRYISNLDTKITSDSIFNMSYENFLFFQEIGDKFSDPAIISMLAGFPAAGDEGGYIRALNTALAEPDENFFHAFGEDYLSKVIQDTGGGPIPVNPAEQSASSMSQEGDSVSATVNPFQITWFGLNYPEHYKLNQATTISVSGLESPVSATRLTLNSEPSDWDDVPDEIDTSCGGESYLVLVSNDSANPNVVAGIRVMHSERKETCAKCLDGTWEVIQDSLGTYESHFTPAHVRFNSAQADVYSFTFDTDTGQASQTIAKLVVDETEVGVSSENSSGGMSPDTEIVEDIDGTITASFTLEESATPDQGTLTFGATQGSATVHIFLNGIDRGTTPLSAEELSRFSLQHAAYTCTEDTLMLTPDITTVPLRFTKVNTGETPTP